MVTAVEEIPVELLSLHQIFLNVSTISGPNNVSPTLKYHFLPLENDLGRLKRQQVKFSYIGGERNARKDCVDGTYGE